MAVWAARLANLPEVRRVPKVEVDIGEADLVAATARAAAFARRAAAEVEGFLVTGRRSLVG